MERGHRADHEDAAEPSSVDEGRTEYATRARCVLAVQPQATGRVTDAHGIARHRVLPRLPRPVLRQSGRAAEQKRATAAGVVDKSVRVPRGGTGDRSPLPSRTKRPNILYWNILEYPLSDDI